MVYTACAERVLTGRRLAAGAGTSPGTGIDFQIEGESLVQDTTLDYSRYFWQGEKVRLRPVRLEDAEHFFAVSLDSPARQVLQLGIELPTSVELMRVSLERYVGCKDADGVILFVIENREGANVGGLSLHSRDQKNGTFGFGVIIDRQHRRHGYAEEAARILLRYAFWERRYQKCDSGCVHTNKASIEFHKKLGFVQEGRRRRRFFLSGHYYDDLLFGLTREEFDVLEEERSGTTPEANHPEAARGG
jgi:RimJ/RimL family protein N-acetyltransferase